MHNIRRNGYRSIPTTAAVIFLFAASACTGPSGSIPGEKELMNYRNATASVVLSAEGEMVGKIFLKNRTNVSYEQIPSHLVNALIATEDVRFFEHKGIDSRSLLRVLLKTIMFNRKSSGGGSTITQQLAKNMFGRNHSGPLSIFSIKFREAVLARRLEKIFTKEEILTLYLNTVSFGENVFGIEAASERYFSKKTELLNIQESAVLVGILKANNYYNPRINPGNARSRRNVVLNQMKKYDYLGEKEADSLCSLPMTIKYSNTESDGPADYFLSQVKYEAAGILRAIGDGTGKKWNIEEDGLIISTTLNLALQNYAKESFRQHLSVMQKRFNDDYESPSRKDFISELAGEELKRLNLSAKAGEVRMRQVFSWDGFAADSISLSDSLKQAMLLLHAGLLAIDPATGAVLAWAGGIDYKTQPYDQVLARRQMASTFKPILYAAAFEEGIRPCYYLDNDSVRLSDFREWKPENFDHSIGGKYSLAGALVHSMNIPTFNLILNVGFDRLDSLWKGMGFEFPLHNSPSLALGTAEANIIETAVAYSSFANGGYRIMPYKIESIKTHDGKIIWQHETVEDTERILTGRTAMLISSVLQRAVTEGTGAAMGSVYGVTLPLAGKTGTSQNNSDAWFAAFNPGLVIVSRVGASLPSVHFSSSSDGSGSALALPLVALTLKQLQENAALTEELIAPFPDLPPELAAELNCPDYREKDFPDKVIDVFKKDKLTYNEEILKPDRKKNILRRMFGPRNPERKKK